MSNINWFIDRIGQTVKRVYEDKETEFEVTDKNVGYLQQFTEKGFYYIDTDGNICKPLTAGKMRPRVYVGGSLCVACEG